MSELKVGDKVWVLCEVATVYNHQSLYMDIRHDGAVFEAKVSECRPVEPPVIKESLTTESNCPEIPDSSVSDPLQVGDAVRFVLPGHKHHGTEGTIVSIQGSSERRYSFESNCGHIKGLCTIAELERIDQADPINPSHYKQGGIECIEAMKVALGGGFFGYLRGNAIKYLWRYDKKNGVEDLKKARWYLDRLIKEVGE